MKLSTKITIMSGIHQYKTLIVGSISSFASIDFACFTNIYRKLKVRHIIFRIDNVSV